MKKVGLLGILLLLMPLNVYAYSFTLTESTEDSTPAKTLMEPTDNGTSNIKLHVKGINLLADIRGVYFDFIGKIGENFSITGSGYNSAKKRAENPVKGFRFETHAAIKPFSHFDPGIKIGTPGIGKDDFRSIDLTIFNNSGLFLGDLFGVRQTSLETAGKREGSSKYVAMYHDPAIIPEPGTLFLFGLGLISLIGVGKKLKKR